MITGMPEVVDPASSLENGAPEYRVKVDRDRAAALGLSVSDVAKNIDYYIDGITPATYWLNGEEINIRLQLGESDRTTLPDLQSLFILSSSGQNIPLSNIASFVLASGPEDITRDNQKRIITVTADIPDGSVAASVSRDIQQLVESTYLLPDGVTITYAGESGGRGMIRAEIIANQSIEEDIIELLEIMGIGEAFTYIPHVHGRGRHGRKEASAVWPEENIIFIIYTEDEQLPVLNAGLESIKDDFKTEGLQCYITAGLRRLV